MVGQPLCIAQQIFEISVTPVNDAPVITSDPVRSATEGVAYRYPATIRLIK